MDRSNLSSLMRILVQKIKLYGVLSEQYHIVRSAQENNIMSYFLTLEQSLCKELEKLIPKSIVVTTSTDDYSEKIKNEYIWFVNIGDGTDEVPHSLSWTLSIALVHNETTLLGLVFNPFYNLLFTATHANGATLSNNTELHIDDYEPHSKPIATQLVSLYDYVEIAQKVQCLAVIGSAMRLCCLTVNYGDFTKINATHITKLVAGLLIARESGCVICDKNGAPPQLRSQNSTLSSIVVTTRHVKDAIAVFDN